MSQKEDVIRYIRENGSINSFESYTQLGITQLATRIKELKEIGFVIDDEWCYTKNRYGRPIKYKNYFLVEEESYVKNSVKAPIIERVH